MNVQRFPLIIICIILSIISKLNFSTSLPILLLLHLLHQLPSVLTDSRKTNCCCSQNKPSSSNGTEASKQMDTIDTQEIIPSRAPFLLFDLWMKINWQQLLFRTQMANHLFRISTKRSGRIESPKPAWSALWTERTWIIPVQMGFRWSRI